MREGQKRSAPADDHQETRENKRPKNSAQSPKIEPGDAGIFATCPLKKEPKCVNELRNLFEEYAETLYGESTGNADIGEEDSIDVAAEINAEVKSLQKPDRQPFFTNVRLDIPCVVFFRTRAPVDPVTLVKAICEDAMKTGKRRTRFTQRLSPMEVMGSASEHGLDEAAAKALMPHFHIQGSASKKFAIRPNIRHHSSGLNRDTVIQKVATRVGEEHKVDLKNYDSLILVEVYKNVCGISVVGDEYERLRKFNLAEIYDPGSGTTLPKVEKPQQLEET